MNREIYSELGETLKEKLKAIWDNPDFINGVVDTLKIEVNMKKLKRLIEQGLSDTDKIILISLAIRRGLV